MESEQKIEEVNIKKGDWVFYLPKDMGHFPFHPIYWRVAQFESFERIKSDGGKYGMPVDSGFFYVNTDFETYSIVPFSEFNPADMEETKKKMCCVRQGKIVREFF